MIEVAEIYFRVESYIFLQVWVTVSILGIIQFQGEKISFNTNKS